MVLVFAGLYERRTGPDRGSCKSVYSSAAKRRCEGVTRRLAPGHRELREAILWQVDAALRRTACQGYHTGGVAPAWTLAGTLYDSRQATAALPGATITITDATGAELTLVTERPVRRGGDTLHRRGVGGGVTSRTS